MKSSLLNKNDLVILSNEKTREKMYWEKKLSQRNNLSHFVFDNIQESDSIDLKSYDTKLSQKCYKLLHNLCPTANLKLFTFLSSALGYVISRSTGSELISLGTPLFNSKDLKNLVTPFLVLNLSVFDNTMFLDLLNTTKAELQAVIENSGYPVHLLNEKLGFQLLNGQPSRLFDISIVLENIQDHDLISKYQGNMSFLFCKEKDELRIKVNYNDKVYSEKSIIDIVQKIERVLFLSFTRLNVSIENLELMTPTEYTKIKEITNGPVKAITKTFCQLFEKVVTDYPHVIALEDHDQSYTYETLSQKSDFIAQFLLSQYPLANKVGIFHQRNADTIIFLIGILKAGMAFVPMNLNDPEDRLTYILTDSDVDILLTDQVNFSNKTALVDFCKEKKIEIITENVLVGYKPVTAVNVPLLDSLAYIIYTSGTTGNPKGVKITHKNLSNYLTWAAETYLDHESACMAVHSNIAFDMTITSIFAPLVRGKKVISYMEKANEFIIPKILLDNSTSVLKLTPSHLKLLLHKFWMKDPETKDLVSNLSLKKLIVGGEELESRTAHRIHHLFGAKVEIYNEYGPTEATVGCIFHKYSPDIDKGKSVPIGKPIDNVQVFVLDSNMKVAPIGFVGELYISGDGISEGYLGNKDLNAQRFIELPKLHANRMYRTGDVALFMPNMDLMYLGRTDDQVKIKGHRIELGEIKNRILFHKDLKETEVLVKKDIEGSNYLVCYYTGKNNLSSNLLREHCLKYLPEYMVPTHFVALDQIPVTDSGKLDKKSLYNLKLDGYSDYKELPSNQLQKEFLQLWKEVLENENIGTNTNFYQAGGDSIRAIRLIAKVNREYSKKFKVIDLFTNPSIKEFSAIFQDDIPEENDFEYRKVVEEINHLKKQVLSEREDSDKIDDVYPISEIQLGMIFHARREKDSALYHDQMIEPMKYKNFNFLRFKKALKILVKKHSILRTCFDLRSHVKPVQIAYHEIEPNIEMSDLSHVKNGEQQIAIQKFLDDDKRNPIGITEPPLWRIHVFLLNKHEIVVVWVVHHAIIDGWSDASFKTEWHNTYMQLAENKTYQPKLLKSNYKDYVIQELLHKKSGESKAFWEDEMTNNKLIQFRDINLKTNISKIGYLSFPFFNEQKTSLENYAKVMNVDIKSIFFSAYIFALYYFTKQDDITIGMVTNNRPEMEDGDKILGCFLNTVPVRVFLDKEHSYDDLVRLVNTKLQNAYKYRQVTLQEIKKTRFKEYHQNSFLFDSIFNYMDFHIYKESGDGGNSIADKFDFNDWSITNYTLTCNVSVVQDGYNLELVYHDGPISKVAAALGKSIQNAVALFMKNYEGALDQVELLDRRSKKSFSTVKWIKKSYVTGFSFLELTHAKEDYVTSEAAPPLLVNSREKDKDFSKAPVQGNLKLVGERRKENNKTPHETVVDILNRQVQKTPMGIALKDGETSLSYKDLGERSDKLAHYLKQNYSSTDKVCVLYPRTADLIVILIAILKSGKAFVPMNLDDPIDRHKFILNDCRTSLLFVDTEYINNGQELKDYCLQEGIDLLEEFDFNHPKGGEIINESSSYDLAYILYTSGTTGRPKGVKITNDNLCHYITWASKTYFDDGCNSISLHANVAFDMSITSIFVPLVTGKSIVLYRQNSDEFIVEKVIMDNQTQVLKVTPSHLKLLLRKIDKTSVVFKSLLENLELKKIIVGGENLTTEVAIKTIELFAGKINIYNEYGPTETTVGCMIHRFNSQLDNGHSVPIGKPISNTKVFVLEENNNDLSVAMEGELYVSSKGVTSGYLNNDKLSAEKLVYLPKVHSEILYRTGDRVRMLEDGNLEFLGRIDNQIKIRGYRVELGEIEQCILRQQYIKEVAVILIENDLDGSLNAYYVSDKDIEVETVIKDLSNSLPEYMIPIRFVSLKNIPLTSGGKLDKNALLNIDRFTIDETYIAPKGKLENNLAQIWSEVLGIQFQKVGTKTSFFKLGGSSLTLMLLMDKLDWQYDVKFSMEELFNNNTIEFIAARIMEKAVLETEAESKITNRTII
ncbi:amino acid adenylation domain-containing protein [Dokdonia sp.]|uniref:amino acid adenylation domain-containing protein n=1 Tax=Dokdonia sp. TaxID=2024995 RepID=UPI0032660674